MGENDIMNNKRREIISTRVLPLLETADGILSSVLDKEQDCCDNFPENLQNGDRYEAIENAIDNLEDAIDNINKAKEYLEAAIG